jgi:hypothetical protein
MFLLTWFTVPLFALLRSLLVSESSFPGVTAPLLAPLRMQLRVGFVSM